MDAQRLVDAFGCSPPAEAPAIPRAIVRAIVGRTVDALLPRLQGEAARALRDPLSALRECPGIAWQPELGIAQALSAADPVAAAIQLLAAAPGTDVDVDPGVGLSAASALYFDGWVARLPEGTRARLSGDRLLFGERGETIAFARGRDGWQPVGAACAGQDVSRSTSATFRHIVGSRHQGSSDMFPALLEAGATHAAGTGVGDDAGGSIAALADALRRLDALPEGDVQWLRQVTHSVWFSAGSAAVASSSPRYPGVVALRRGAGWDAYAEAIASSVAQQKLHQLLLVSALVDGEAEEIHYVPASRTYTTTRRALAAAYEHAQVARLLRAAADVAPGAMAEPLRRRALRRGLRLEAECASPLDGSKALGRLGAALWQDIGRTCADARM
jgi:hypothetical protein